MDNAIFMALVVIGLYFTPSIVAYSSKKGNRVAILALNFFAGWTLIGWLVALVWALTKDPKNG